MGVVPDFSVVIPVCNKWELTENCLRSLREHSGESAYEVIVVDNGSSDKTASALPVLGEALFGRRFSRLRFEENRNFGPACNAGAGMAAAALVFFLNNDTLLTPGWAPPLLQALAADASLGGAGPLLLYEDGTVQHLGVVFSLYRVEHLYRGFPAEHPAVRRTRHCRVLTAAALMLRRELFLRQGGFCEEYRNGFEDVDFCLHLGKAGKRLACIPASVVYHLESRTSGRKSNEEGNAAILNRRCGDLFRADKHQQGVKDGFFPFITDSFDIGLRLKEEEEEALFRKAAGRPLHVWHQYCKENPYWVRGREYLATALEKEGYAAESLFLRAEVAAILPLASACRDLMLAAERLGDEGMRAEAEADFHSLAESRRNRALLRRTLDLNKKRGDRALEVLLDEKLREIRLPG